MHAKEKTHQVSANNPKDDTLGISDLRAQIDALDDEIFEMFKRRTEIVAGVGKLKKSSGDNPVYLRAGREALMVRRIVEKFKDAGFHPAAAGMMWRFLISASLSVESPISVCCHVQGSDFTNYWLAREYFGTFTPVTRQPTASRVISDVIERKVMVGMLSMPKNDERNPWWLMLMQGAKDLPKIFAIVPFVVAPKALKDDFVSLAIGLIPPEPTGDDVSLIAIEMEASMSMNRLNSLFEKSFKGAKWISMTTLANGHRVYLSEIPEFVTHEHEALASITTEAAGGILQLRVLGSYARPVIVE